MTNNWWGWILVWKSRGTAWESLYNINQIWNILSVTMDTTAKLSDVQINSILTNSQENILYAYNIDIANYYVFMKLLNNTWNSIWIMTQMQYSDNINWPWSPEWATYQASWQANWWPSAVTHTWCTPNEYNWTYNYRVLIDWSCSLWHWWYQSFNWAHNMYDPPTIAGSEINLLPNFQNSLWFIK